MRTVVTRSYDSTECESTFLSSTPSSSTDSTMVYVSFCPERTLSVLIFLYFLQGEQRHISPSEDFEVEQGVWNIDSLHPGQDMEFFRMFFWNRKSRAFSREATGPFISSSIEKSTMSGIRIVDDGN